MSGSARDPVSVLFDAGARRLLARAYAAPGQWVGTRVAAPTVAHIAHFAAMGINVLGTDQWGRDRWAAGFVRAVYYQHRWYYAQGRFGSRRLVANNARGVQYELGRRLPVLGVIPAGRAVRIRTRPGGAAAERAVRRLPESARIWDDAGNPGGRFSSPADRDY